MRTTGLLMAMVVLAAGAGTAQAVEVTIVSGGAALGSYEQTSADGCVRTWGDIAVVEAKHGNGDLANGLYVTGMRQNHCTDDNGAGYAGFFEGRFDVFALLWGHFAGTVVVESYSGGAPLTFDLDLSWLGTGKVSRSHDVFDDGSAINFTFDASRAAITRGRFTIDGAPASVTTATLALQASGQIVR
jgi:hypothetical protein